MQKLSSVVKWYGGWNVVALMGDGNDSEVFLDLDFMDDRSRVAGP